MVKKEVDEKILKDLEAQLGGLEAKRLQIEAQIKEQRKRIAIKKGEVVGHLKDLKCERHPNARFVRMQEIKNSFGFTGDREGKPRELWLYVCEECLKEKEAGKISPAQMSTAYECPHCGFVKGVYISRPYESSPESWRALAGRKGEHYYCRVCGSLIGYDYWMVS